MTKERLQSFSSEELKLLAVKAGLDVDTDDKELLIDEIIDAYEEDKIERRMATNLAMLIKQKKYELILDDDDITLNQDDVEDLYSGQLQVNTGISLMLRDPRWAFAYWDYSKTHKHRLLRQKGDLVLRVYQTKEGGCSVINGDGTEQLDYFDIPVSLEDRKWYINLPDPGTSYIVELLNFKNEIKETLCRSNKVQSPSLFFDESFRNNIDDMIISSGLYDIALNPGGSSDSGHRILSTNESNFISQELDK